MQMKYSLQLYVVVLVVDNRHVTFVTYFQLSWFYIRMTKIRWTSAISALNYHNTKVSIVWKQTFHNFNVENTSLQLMFSTFPSCSQMPVMFYHSVIHSLGFFIC